MKLIIGEDFITQLERFTYRGCIGLFYNTTWEGVLTYIVFGLVLILAVVGLISIIKSIVGGGSTKPNKSGLTKQEQNWLHGKK